MGSNQLAPKPKYLGRNGFHEPVLKELDEPQAVPVSPGPSGAASAPKAQREKRMRALVEKHRQVEDMLEIKGSYFPGLEAMQAGAKPTAASDLTSLIQETQKRHEKEIEKLMDLQTKDHISRVLDAYQSADGIVNLPELNRSMERQTLLYMPAFTDASSEYNNYRYAHLCTVNALIKRRDELLAKEERERKIRDAQFPGSIAQWRSENPDIQLRVAKFLVSDKSAKERMLSQFGWAWRQVEPLEKDYATNNTFQADIKARASVKRM
ncbi:uncharacterized protein PHACADRAFT_188531 [Phanerochaete carnosa HHB-10118-sp]|uniref:Uncharacterized protein n=1 Tax=Phanerochaete carnosa (strain HHB-10118-sp) TaxID=650164 RepID=K5VUF1_PHACS|nr:uncharacterized protein PHACADRAFT_188531 [Phanerochaete carnosa HHB-10118-sp]EKM50209.1 hypothetical protein PHACADRAFT_188531 [Phanerochaete carnosa HHB-10118-sp]